MKLKPCECCVSSQLCRFLHAYFFGISLKESILAFYVFISLVFSVPHNTKQSQAQCISMLG